MKYNPHKGNIHLVYHAYIDSNFIKRLQDIRFDPNKFGINKTLPVVRKAKNWFPRGKAYMRLRHLDIMNEIKYDSIAGQR